MRYLVSLLLFFSVQTLRADENGEFFRKYDYLWIKNFFSQEEVAQLKTWSDEIHEASLDLLKLAETTGESLEKLIQTVPGALIVVKEAGKPQQVCRAEDFLMFSPAFTEFMDRKITSFISELQGETYVPFKEKLNFKWPGGGAFPPHQDFPAYEFLCPREHVTAMVCVDAATLENGCLQVADDWRQTFAGDPTLDAALLTEGKAVLPFITGGKLHGSIETEYSDQITWIPLEASAGDLILISSYVPHYSEPNRSSNPRRAMLFTFSRLEEGEQRIAYYKAKRDDPNNPIFHIATPTDARNK